MNSTKENTPREELELLCIFLSIGFKYIFQCPQLMSLKYDFCFALFCLEALEVGLTNEH